MQLKTMCHLSLTLTMICSRGRGLDMHVSSKHNLCPVGNNKYSTGTTNVLDPDVACVVCGTSTHPS